MKQGFTFVEVAIAGFITSTIIVVFSIFTTYLFTSYNFSFSVNQTIAIVEDCLRRMTLEIREARPSENGEYTLITTDDAALAFYGDIDNDGSAEKIRYFLDGTDLKKGVIEPSGVPAQYLSNSEKITILASSVSNGTDPIFTYYNGNWPGDTQNNPLTPVNRQLKTRLISVKLRIAPNDTNVSDPFELTTAIQLRNLKDNL